VSRRKNALSAVRIEGLTVCLTTCLPSQIGPVRYLRRQRTAQVEPSVALSVIVRRGPARTAVNGTLAARQAGIGGMGWRRRSLFLLP
jgi:hypothetical protein